MASHQQQIHRDENRGGEEERETHVRKDIIKKMPQDIVPKMATHFESLGKKNNKGEKELDEQEKNAQFEKNREMKTEEAKKDAQLKENRGEIETEESLHVEEQGGEKKQPLSLEEISKYRQEAQQKSNEAILAAQEKAAKLANDAKGGVAEKGGQAKDSLVQGVQATTRYLAEKGTVAKDVALDKGQQTCAVVKDYAVETAGKAKDVSVETGKGAATYAGKVAVDVKDKAVVAGWGAAHLTAEAAVEGTKMAAGAVTTVGRKAVEVAAATGESLKEYTARKQEEAKRDLETKKSQGGEEQEMTEKVSQFVGEGGRCEMPSDDEKQCRNKESECQETEFGAQRQEVAGTATATATGGVLGAIGETIVEIAQTAKGLVTGEDQPGKETGYQGSTMKDKKQ